MTMIQTPYVTPEVLNRGHSFAWTLREEGRSTDAETVEMFISAVNGSLLTVEQVAKRIHISQESVLKWIEKGWLMGVLVGEQVMIPANTLEDLEEIEAIERELNKDRLPATTQEIVTTVIVERSRWRDANRT